MRVDVHAHYFPERYLDFLDRHGGPPTAIARDPLAGDAGMGQRLAAMDAAGIGRQILSVAPVLPDIARADAGVTAARLANDAFAALIGRHPDRFAAFASLPLPHIDASLAELARTADQLGFPGAVMGTSIFGRSLASPELAPVFEELNRRRAVLFLHPLGTGTGPLTAEHGLTWLVGAPYEDTLAAAHLMLSGLLDRFPGIDIIVPHLGGTLPFLLQRLDDQYRRHPNQAAAPPSRLARRLWYDTVNSHPAALRCARDSVGADRLLLGTDFPYLPGPMFTRAVEYIADSGIPAGEASAITEGNALRLFARSGRVQAGPTAEGRGDPHAAARSSD
ncbi:amidohydrolase family protein [Wenjunlia tyrosinilytica]|uniref:Amidohydrolase (Aminocarboxymuconate-semialdehyde decarboxylase) n=1 Tax=Wenjunlia tyrosinilytica TaxID=1544741 RepID=A0A917ZUL8_9ACTN|nr:amidohydrolase family protein [Wenjunlia tyrosinilytica]GGO94743.1 putative amidohydrolase (aminocarboxymuconate-semialdehyde decarboxylase) [Wenjunlia tyrosinilytica]